MAEHLGNDTRGWIMAAVSGVACIFGACIICIDFLIRLFPGKRDFQVQNSDTFLSSSLSLSFGVLLFSSLYNILPESKTSFIHGGYSASAASWALIGCFIGGVIGIQFLSRIFHHFMPSHVVGCEHTHDASDEEEARGSHNHEHELDAHHSHGPGHSHGHVHDHGHHSHYHGHHGHRHSHRREQKHQHNGRLQKFTDIPSTRTRPAEDDNAKGLSESEPLLSKSKRPPPLTTRVSSFFAGAKTKCDGKGSCYGYSDPCGNECYKIKARRASTVNLRGGSVYGSSQPPSAEPDTGRFVNEVVSRETSCGASGHLNRHHNHNTDPDVSSESTVTSCQSRTGSQHEDDQDDVELSKSHHHHVPSNAFLSIGLQTSFAIALHKLPEGFITYATNHANPELGFSIFVALFIHNITEGFALALPLYLAIHSRWKAILTAAILGGASQPLGAAIAALWFHLDGDRGVATNEVVYGCMFAITSGIMTSVALQLFSESLALSHSRSLCIIWAFVGMAFLGMSSALTA